uniref:C2 domain-containing protein n=1 Tax=Zea mays TaxID=4577 RepID=E7DDV8_MAIZE|nr:C2 domain-containing protein [Zea mays]
MAAGSQSKPHHMCDADWQCMIDDPELPSWGRRQHSTGENNMDPFVILTCRTQEQKSSVANGAGSEPEWNETFVFTVSDDTPQLHLKIMDSDLTNDDFVGEATIPLEAVFQEGSLPPAVHPVVKEEKYCGEVKLALTFTPAAETRRPDDNEEGPPYSSWS